MSRRRPRKPTVRDIFGDRLTMSVSWPASVTAAVCVMADAPSIFGDDVLTVCAGCGVDIRHRPYIPLHVTKLCPACGLGTNEGAAA